MNCLIAHWGENKRHIFDAVVSSLEKLGANCTWIQRDDMEVREQFLSAIRSREYQCLLTWQRFYPMQTDILAALAESHIRTVCMDFGFVPHYETVVFDTKGEGGVSQMREDWKSPHPGPLSEGEGEGRAHPTSTSERGRNESILREYALRAVEIGGHTFPEKQHIRLPFVFLPLQRPQDSTVKYDSTVHDFKALVLKVFSLCAPNLFLVVKTHPVDRAIDLGVPDFIPGKLLVLRRGFNEQSERLNDFLLSQASIVVGINSNMLFRAMVFNRPVISLGEGWFTGSGAYHDVAGLEGLESLASPVIDHAARRRTMATCLSRQVSHADLTKPGAIRRALVEIGIELPAARAVAIPA